MGRINWLEQMGWTEDHLEDLRYAGYAYIRQGKYDIALPFFEALSVLDPESSYDAQTLGALYLQLNNPVKALKAFVPGAENRNGSRPYIAKSHEDILYVGKEGRRLETGSHLEK